MTTLKEIAQICGVSMMTVSNVINGKSKASKETQKRILAVVAEKGYTPNYVAQGLRTKKTRTIAMIAEDIGQFTSPLLMEGAVAYCEEAGYRVVMQNLRLYARWSNTWYNQEEAFHSVLDPALQEVKALHPDGVIYIAGHSRYINCFDDLAIPVVMVHAYSNSKKVPSVVVDDEVSAYEIVNYLISKGHKKIGVVAGQTDNIHTQKRMVGYKKALEQNGITFDENIVYYAGWSRDSGYVGAQTLLKNDITAIFSMSDQMAGGIYDYMREHNIEIGKGISVAAFDNAEFSQYMTPKLTTTTLPLKEMGRKGAELLMDMVRKDPEERKYPKEPEIIKIPCSFVERESVYIK